MKLTIQSDTEDMADDLSTIFYADGFKVTVLPVSEPIKLGLYLLPKNTKVVSAYPATEGAGILNSYLCCGTSGSIFNFSSLTNGNTISVAVVIPRIAA